MKHLPLPVFDDEGALDLLERSRANIRHPLSRGLKHVLRELYAVYEDRVATPGLASSKVKGLSFTPAILIAAYEDPPVAIKGMKEQVQWQLSPNVCPMCGSLKTGTADHYLPKTDFPEYSFFSKNLIPACDCNTKRGEQLSGPGVDEYVMHPFFEPLMSQRIVTIKFYFALGVSEPVLSIGKLYPTGLPAAAVDFHVKSVHEKTTMLSWAAAEWGRLVDVPLAVLTWGKRYAGASRTDLLARIEEIVDCTDEKLGTPNNWTSAFFHGVMNSPEAIDRVLESVAASAV